MLEDMAINTFNWQSKRAIRKLVGVHNIDSYSALATQVESHQKQMYKISTSTSQPPMVTCEFYVGDHETGDCPSIE